MATIPEVNTPVPATERALRPLIALDDPESQLEAIRELLGDFVAVEA